MNILFTKTDCPLCAVVKTKLNAAQIEYTNCMDEEEMDKLNIEQLPVLQLATGELLQFRQIIDYIAEVTK